jgi:hypothetical protein
LSSSAQIAQPIVPLPLDGELRPTQLPPAALLGSPQCDSVGTVYVRYAMQDGGSYVSNIARVEADGSTETFSLGQVQGENSHVFTFAVDRDGAMYEILRAAATDAREMVEYVRFDGDGDVRSREPFGQELIPSAFLPLPNGNFFLSGIMMKETNDGVSESPVAGIFGANAHLQRRLRGDVPARTLEDDGDVNDAFLHAESVRLGDDGNMYVLLDGDHAKIAVVSQAGRIVRQLKLQEPFENGVASDMWVSEGRLLVVYEGEADDPKDSFVYVLYDVQSGEVIRQYKPDFRGTLACFQDGQTLSVLVRQPLTGNVGITTAELR